MGGTKSSVRRTLFELTTVEGLRENIGYYYKGKFVNFYGEFSIKYFENGLEPKAGGFEP
jgi:hypothetical protein